jgi:lipopolysaccharide transport system permease protein
VSSSKAVAREVSLDAAVISANFFRKIVLQRHLIWNFAVRDLKKRYVGSFMGFFWTVVHPLVLLASYTFVFSIIFQIRPGLSRVDNFAVFAFCGILPWLYFQETVMRSCTSVTDNGNLIKKTLFPSEILPITVLLSNLATHLAGFGILLAVLAYMNLLNLSTLAIPIVLLPLLILSLGLGWLAAALQVFLRDTAQVLSVLLVFWFWFTPIFYEVERVPAPFKAWIALNPMSHVVEGYRSLLLENRWPDFSTLLHLYLAAAVAFVIGGLVFRNTKRQFADVL